MKKILAVICFSFLSLNTANAEITLGISGNAGLLSATGKETQTGSTGGDVVWGATAAAARTAATATATTTTKKQDEIVVGYVTAFGELGVFGTGLRLGISYVPYPIESETTSNDRRDNCSSSETHIQTSESTTTTDNNVCTVTKNNVQVDLEDLISMYAAYHHDIDSMLLSSVFIKAGIIQADVITNETLASGSKYANTTLSGEFFGIGVEKNLENEGMFVRLEGNVTKFDSIKLTNTSGGDNANTINISGMDGATATLSIGKTF
tara:strand:- start:317 stop:1111 length:795 start_codon:yes stop_codon:yes gene_type:complete